MLTELRVYPSDLSGIFFVLLLTFTDRLSVVALCTGIQDSARDEKLNLNKLAPCRFVANISILRNKHMENMVNATFAQLFTPPWFLVCKWRIYSSVFTDLRHICKEQICANPFFCSVVLPIRIPRLRFRISGNGFPVSFSVELGLWILIVSGLRIP